MGRGDWIDQFAGIAVFSERLNNFIMHIQCTENPYNTSLVRSGVVKYRFTSFADLG